MKIIYVSTSFFLNTSASIRNISLVNGLIENGHEVTVITLDYLEKFEDKYLKTQISDKVKINKVKIPILNKLKLNANVAVKERKLKFLNKMFLFLKNYLFFPDNCKEAIKNINEVLLNQKFDLIISSSDSKTSHYMALELNKKYNKKWVQIWGDPWSGDINLKKLGNFYLKKVEKEEKKILEKANKIIYISELTLKDMKNKYPDMSSKMNFIFRGFLKAIYSEENMINLEKKEQIRFVYTGSGVQRNFIPILEKIKEYNISNTNKIVFEIYGAYIQDLNYDFLKVNGVVSFDKIENIYKESDVLVYIDNQGETTQIPGKIYDYCGTEKKILALVENNETEEYLKRFKRIEIYKNKKNEIDLEEILKKISKQNIIEKFSPKHIAQDLMEKIESMEEK